MINNKLLFKNIKAKAEKREKYKISRESIRAKPALIECKLLRETGQYEPIEG